MPYKQTGKRSATAVAKKTEVLDAERRLVPPGTPQRVSEAVGRSSKHTCPTCAQLILEETDDVQGQEAILCEGSSTAGTTVGAQVYQHNAMKLSPAQKTLSIVLHAQPQQSILELQSSIRTLTEEVHELRAVVAALEEPAKAENDPSTEALLKEVRELKTAIAAMQENYSSSSSHSHAESNKNFKDAYSWSDVVRRKPKGKGKGKGSGGMGTGEKSVGSDQRGRKQPDAQGPSMQSASIYREQTVNSRKHAVNVNLYLSLGSAKFGVRERSVPQVL